MADSTPKRNGEQRATGERMAELGRLSAKAKRAQREALEAMSVDDKAERELDRMLSSDDPKEREKGLRQYGYVRGKRQPTPAKAEPELQVKPQRRGGAGLRELNVMALAYVGSDLRPADVCDVALLAEALTLARASQGHHHQAQQLEARLLELAEEKAMLASLGVERIALSWEPLGFVRRAQSDALHDPSGEAPTRNRTTAEATGLPGRER